MTLIIDIGNSDTVLGIFNHTGEILQVGRQPTPAVTEYDNLATILNVLQIDFDSSPIHAIAISSVVPDVLPLWISLTTNFLNKAPFVLDATCYPCLAVEITNPEEMGTDLVANAVAGYEKTHCATLVIDFGTALTFTTTDDAGIVQGVAIAPGLKTALLALVKNTALLSEIPLVLPPSVLGKTTKEALQAGIMHGYIGLVKEIIDQTKKTLAVQCKVIATGGLVHALTPLHPYFDFIDKHHTLKGIYLCFKQYQKHHA